MLLLSERLQALAFEGEKRALMGDHNAVIRLVSLVRSYRAASEKLLDSRSLISFREEIVGAEKMSWDDDE